jgi:homogentisate 1,2-dioxygenase
MHHYKQGQTTEQAHKGIPEGAYEEEQGLKGFFGPVSHLIRKSPSTRWAQIEGPLKPHLYDLIKLPEAEGVKRLFYNAAVEISWQWVEKKSPDKLRGFRSADGDLLYFCHKGEGEFLTEYGLLPYRRGHYITVPKCVVHTIAAKEKSNFFVIENLNSHYEEPARGIAGRHAFYDINALGKPDLEAQMARLKEWGDPVREIEVKRDGGRTRFLYDATIYDVIGWKGDMFPFTLHVDQMMPIHSHRAHLPPSAHTTLVARDFVVCTFLPRPLEKDADALKVPFYHQNIDYDEILFYHDGDFFSRDNLHAGMLSLHPAGFPHGPHPKAFKAAAGKTETKEYAVMVDSRLPLKCDNVLSEVEATQYWKSWQG